MDRIRNFFNIIKISVIRFWQRANKTFSQPVIMAALLAAYVAIFQLVLVQNFEGRLHSESLLQEEQIHKSTLLHKYFDYLEDLTRLNGDSFIPNISYEERILLNSRTNLAVREQHNVEGSRELILSTLSQLNLLNINGYIIELEDFKFDDIIYFDKDLSNLYLSGLFAPNSTFSRTDFSNSDLSNARLVSSRFRNSIFANTNLSNSIISLSYLSEADFSGANLTSSILSFSDLRYANFDNSNLSSADMFCVDLRDSVNLDISNLASAYRLRFSFMQDGSIYDGRYQLAGDIEMAKLFAERNGVFDIDDEFMASFYSVKLDQYKEGKTWAENYLDNYSNSTLKSLSSQPNEFVNISTPYTCDLLNGSNNPPIELNVSD